MSDKKKIVDFGERIEGARKHMYEYLHADLVDDMTDKEREAYIKKENIWKMKTADYQKLYDEGVPREVVYFIKKLHDSLPNKPTVASEDLREEILKGYINFVSHIRDEAMKLRTVDEAKNFFRNAVISSEYVAEYNRDSPKQTGAFRYRPDRSSAETYGVLANSGGCITNKFLKAVNYDGYSISREIEKKQFLYTEEEKLIQGYTFFRYDGNNAEVRDGSLALRMGFGTYYFHGTDERNGNPENWQKDTYVVISPKRTVEEINFSTLEEAKAFAVDLEREKQKNNPEQSAVKKSRKEALTPPQLSHITREGYDYRNSADTQPEHFLKELEIRGGQFGNWTNQNDRQTNMNMAYDAFRDIAVALGIADRDVSLGGELAIAWGARGQGRAVAHYEPFENVINLTKMKGAGSLAHEWGHALDSYLAENGDFFATDSRDGILADVVQTMKYKEADGIRTETDFYKDAKKLDGNFSASGNQKGKDEKNYWQSDVELFARAFACYVYDRLAEQGMRNDYLCGHANRAVKVSDKHGSTHTVHIHPEGDERKAINESIDRVIEQLKERGVFHEYGSDISYRQISETVANDIDTVIKPKGTEQIDMKEIDSLAVDGTTFRFDKDENAVVCQEDGSAVTAKELEALLEKAVEQHKDVSFIKDGETVVVSETEKEEPDRNNESQNISEQPENTETDIAEKQKQEVAETDTVISIKDSNLSVEPVDLRNVNGLTIEYVCDDVVQATEYRYDAEADIIIGSHNGVSRFLTAEDVADEIISDMLNADDFRLVAAENGTERILQPVITDDEKSESIDSIIQNIQGSMTQMQSDLSRQQQVFESHMSEFGQAMSIIEQSPQYEYFLSQKMLVADRWEKDGTQYIVGQKADTGSYYVKMTDIDSGTPSYIRNAEGKVKRFAEPPSHTAVEEIAQDKSDKIRSNITRRKVGNER